MPDTDLDGLLRRHREGDPAAADAIVSYFAERLRVLTRSQLRRSPRVRRWEMTDDVAQNVAMRMVRALTAVQPGRESDLVNLAAELIRRELVDLARKHAGPEGTAANHATDGKNASQPRYAAAPGKDAGPETAARMGELHALVAELPDEERQVFDLIYYGGLTQPEAAARLGTSPETIKRRYRRAKLRLADLLGDLAEG